MIPIVVVMVVLCRMRWIILVGLPTPTGGNLEVPAVLLGTGPGGQPELRMRRATVLAADGPNLGIVKFREPRTPTAALT
jgi:hypothetical protein